MQTENSRRSNEQRTKATRTALLTAARKLFVEKGYAETGTPEIVAAAKVTRGALYHHFKDKADLFRAVLQQEAQAVARQIEAETEKPATPLDALLCGAHSYFGAMSVAGRTRLLLQEGPAVLGRTEMNAIDDQTGAEELRQGLAHAMPDGEAQGIPIAALTKLLSSAFDRAALEIAEGAPQHDFIEAIRLLVTGLPITSPKG